MKKSRRVIRSSTYILAAACILLYGIYAAFAYALSLLSSETQTRTRINDIGTLAVGVVADYLDEKAESVAQISSRPDAVDFIMDLRTRGGVVMTTGKYIPIHRLMETTGNLNSDVRTAFALDNGTGNLVNGRGDFVSHAIFDLRQQPWFINAVSASDTNEYIVTSVHESIFDEGVRVFSLLIPVSENKNVVGYYGVEIDASMISHMMNSYILSADSFPIISTSAGEVIYAPSGNSDFADRYDVTKPPISEFLSHQSGLSQLSNSYIGNDNKPIFYYFDSYSIPNWSVLVVFDEAGISGGSLTIFALEASVLLLLVALFFIIINSIMRDKLALISPIAKELSDFGAGNFKTRINSEKGGELGFASRALDALGRELSEKTQAAESFRYTDPTTGLSNRVRLYECIEEHISSRSDESNSFAVLFIDLDNFKWLNETYGHKFGDDALSVFAKVMTDAVTPESQAFRYSGDEFILVYDYTVREDLDSFTEKLRAAFSKPFRVQNDKIYFRFSCGIALYPDNGLTADDILRQAASALSAAKAMGKNCSAFVPEDEGAGPKKAYIAQVLSHALHNRELYLHYQPIISMETNTIYGFEALLRWESAEFGNIPPSDFIKVAEESGEIVQIGMWILENACRFIQRVNKEYNRDIVISVNVSPVQLRKRDYIEHIRNVLAISRINPANIQLEITEGNLVDFIDNKNDTLEEVIATGITLALDDFGNGYSSLNYLKNLPVKALKISKMFISENPDEKSEAITASTIELVHSLGLIIVVEGVESREQYEKLKSMHCDYIQGYLFSKPLPEDRAIQFIPQYESLHGGTSAL
ncbi:MAG: EAL domain-containing protein [Ruminococcus sp.]|nr:EAL domain-containing protein [Ruminococcus sp.]